MSTVAPLPPPGTVEGRGIVKGGVTLGKAVELRRPGASLDGCGVDKKEWGRQVVDPISVEIQPIYRG